MARSRATVERVSDTELVWKHTLRAKPSIVFDTRVGPVLTCKPVCAGAVPSRWDLTLGDIELF